jgi:hypothetical protein
VTSKERIIAAWEGRPQDHVPLTTWCFGFAAPEDLQWEREGRARRYWYSMRMEHIHTQVEPWDVEDDFRRVLTWRSLEVDDVLDVSVPWSADPEVTWKDSVAPAGALCRDPVLVREYRTPSGPLRHAVRKTSENQGPGWVVQPDYAALFEDLNIPRAQKHAVASVADVGPASHLYRGPDARACERFRKRMDKVRAFAEAEGAPVQAWSAFGMDAVVWMAGVENAVLMATDEPEAFSRVVESVAAADVARTKLAVSTPGVDMVVQRGWYSATDFWSPALFDRYTLPQVKTLADLAHRHGRRFGYVMTTGVETLGPRLADAGVDVLYFVDPVQDRITVERARDLLADRMTLVGGMSALTLVSRDPARIRDEVRRAMDALGPTDRFILHPLDALFPDTPWQGVETMIETWREYWK